MTVRVVSHNTEFGYELIATLPYAYWLHVNGMLEATVSAPGSEAFYWFSPHHEIDPAPRDFAHTARAAKEIPNMWIHKPRLDKSRWIPPPFREYFLPMAITFEKPTVVICNRYNKEWGRDPVNFFDLPTLRKLFSLLCPQYTVVYVNVRGREELEDNAHSMDLGDYDMIAQEFPMVRVIHDLVDEHGGDFNHVQCRVFAGCRKFITMNGGHSILCSYFGGENIIYTKECRELGSSVNSFYNWYHDLGGSHVRVTNAYEDLLRLVGSAWVDKDPLLNILVRMHERPKGAQRLLESIRVQEYPNIRIIASYDNEATWKYVLRLPVEKMAVTPGQSPQQRPMGDAYRGFLAANAYLNELASRVQDGWILYMDDDDIYADGALKRIAKAVRKDKVLFWKAVKRGGSMVPSEENWGKVAAGDISGIAMAFHHKHLHLAQWEPWRRGDYRVAKALEEAIGAKWLDAPLSIMADRIDIRMRPSQEQLSVQRLRKADRINALVAARRLERQKAAAVVAQPLPIRAEAGVTIRRYRPT